jgi:hypothetical protein
VIVRSRVAGDPTVPSINDLILLENERELYLQGFGLHGERDRLEAPANRALEEVDRTGLRLSPGTVVRVCDVVVETLAARVASGSASSQRRHCSCQCLRSRHLSWGTLNVVPPAPPPVLTNVDMLAAV